MASPNQPPPSPTPFDMHTFFNPPNPNPNPNPNISSQFPSSAPSPPPPSSSSSYPFPHNNNNYPYDHHHHQLQLQHQHQQQHHQQNQTNFPIQHRSISFPTPPLQPPQQPQPIPPPSNPNAGARLMALLSTPPIQQQQPPPPQSQPISSGAVNPAITAANAAAAALIRLPSSKVPKGRHLIGDHVVYDVDVRLPGEVQPQLEVAPITKYGSDPNPVLGRQIAVNKSYICYGLKQGNIRVLNIHTAVRSLLRGHTQRVTDLAFFAEDVHLLASVGTDGRVFVWKISEGPDDEDKPQITANIVIAVQIVGEEKVEHPQICWHCHKQEILIVGMGKNVLRIDTTKVGNGEAFVAEDPPKCPLDKLIDGVQLVGTHDGEVTDLSMCQWMTNRLVSASQDGTIKIWEDRKTQPLAVFRPHDGHPVFSATFFTAPHQPDHIVLITAGPQNREVKLWVSASEEGWLLPSDTETWKCTQTLELKSSAKPSLKDAFFNQVAALPHAGLLLLANAQRNAIYAVHLEYGPNPESTRMDYMAEFTVTMPILSFTGTSDILPHGEHIVQVYCVQTLAIQQYALDLAQCLPPPLENVGLDKSDSSVSRDAITAEGFASLDSSAGRTSEMSFPSSAPKTTMQASSTESGLVSRYPLSSGHTEAPISRQISSSNVEAKTVTLAPSSSDADIVCVPSIPPPLSPRLSRKLSDFRSPQSNLSDHVGDQAVNDYSVDRQMDTIHRNLSDQFNSDTKNDDNKIKQDDISTVLNPSAIFKQPTHLVTPSEITKASSSSETNMVDRVSEVETKIQDVVDVGNAEVEVKVVGEARPNQNDELGRQGPQQNPVSDGKEKFFCSQASDLGIEMARECGAIGGETYITEEPGQVDSTGGDSLAQPSNAGEDGLQDLPKDVHEKVSDSSTSMVVPPSPASNTKGKRQKGKNSQPAGPSSPSPSACNSTDSSNEPNGISNLPCTENSYPQIVAMQDSLNQLLTMQKEMQKQMTMTVTVPVTKEGRRLEAALGRSMEKAVKSNADALWARIQEENAKNEKMLRDRFQHVTGLITNFMNKDLPAVLEKTVKKEMTSVAQALVRSMSPAIEKTLSSTIAESFQRGVGDKAVNQLDKSVNLKLEATVARQIQAQFQTTVKQALQDALKSSFETTVVPAFEMSCKAMFEQVDSTFQKGMAEHSNAVQQRLESGPTSLAMTLRDSINSASSVTQTLSREVLEGQRKLMALATSRTNSGTLNTLPIQLNNGPLLHEKVEAPLDPTKELARLISERKYEEAFIAALHRSDVSIVSWLCSQVDLHTLTLQFLTLVLFFFMIGKSINARDLKVELRDQNQVDSNGAYITAHNHEAKQLESNKPYITGYGKHEAKQPESNEPYITGYGKHEAKQPNYISGYKIHNHESNGPYITQYGKHETKQQNYITGYRTHNHESNGPYITQYGKHETKQPNYITGYKYVIDPKGLPSTNSVEDLPIPNLDHTEAFKTGYFSLDDLHIGNVMTLQFPVQEVSPYLSKKEADSIPFSMSQLPSILQLFSIPEASPQAKSMRGALEECEGETVTGETKICANSLESMLEFVDTIIGSNVKYSILTTSNPSPRTTPLQKYTVLEVSHDIDVPKWVACHPLPYPYAIYYCHYIATKIKVFKVSLVSDQNGDKIEALGVCHFDTSEWNPNHIIFKQLGIKAGRNSPVCHFFPVNHLMWIPM